MMHPIRSFIPLAHLAPLALAGRTNGRALKADPPRRLASLVFILTFAIGASFAPQALADGRTHAIVVGISNYPDGVLPRQDADAERVAAALRRSVPADRLALHLLLNDAATRAGVTAALRDVARSSDASDTFVFFYTGHGSQIARNGWTAEEPDSIDETLHLIDGDFTDDQLSDALDRIQSRLALIALDSCFSGGFQNDVLDHPGRIGMFSSDEDLTSGVPDDAGGYLSKYLAEALEGRADGVADGVVGASIDGKLTALELEVYVRDRFAEDRRLPASDGNDRDVGFQFVKIERAGVAPDTQILDVDPDAPRPAQTGNVVASYEGRTLAECPDFDSRPALGDFQLEAGHRYRIETYDLSPGADTVIELRRSSDPRTAHESDPVVRSNDDVSPNDLSSRIELVADQTGPYYVSVHPYDASGTGTFSLRVIDLGAR
jgi:hypothetical protein